MTRELFANKVAEAVGKLLGSEYEVNIRRVSKNNGMEQMGISVCRKGAKAAPIIYLDEFYAEMEDEDIQDAAKKAVELYRCKESLPASVAMAGEQCCDFNNVRDRVCFKLINTKRNERLLERIPNMPYLDLSIVFYLFLGDEGDGIITAMIYNEHLAIWDVDVQRLYGIALDNMQRIQPAVIRNVNELLFGITEDVGDEGMPFHILTAESGMNGAACMLYPRILAGFSEKRGKDIFILPSSLHEVLLLEDTGEEDCGALMELVKHVNATEVPAEDVLSGSVYKYERCGEKVTIAA